MSEHGIWYITFAIISAWIAGLGRYWDHPSAEWWQYAGLGSVAYIFVLALFLWIFILPLRPRNWTYKLVLVFVGLTSPLAWIYAVPVEQFLAPENAILANVWFLKIVAVWRVALYGFVLWRVANLRNIQWFVGTFAPLAFILVALSSLNLEHAVFEIMAGIEREPTARDAMYGNIVMLSFGAIISAPIFLIFYLMAIFKR